MTQPPIAPATSAETTAPKSSRLMSLDALRGFDMFWIIGADAIVEGLRKVSDHQAVHKLAEQLQHVSWAGFHFEDLIFPMFVFIVGVSLAFSLTRTVEQEGRAAAAVRIFRRALLLYLLGIFYYGGMSTPFEGIRLLGVLQRIAIAYLFSGLLFWYVGLRGRVAVCVGMLLGYWALLTFVPVPELGAGHFEPGHNLANWVDKNYLPLRRWDGDYDPEGLLSTIPAIANCLLGVFAGELLRSKREDWRKVVDLIAAGALSAILGWLWDFQFPVIKQLWTSSFVLVAVGYSSILLGLFYLVIDIWKLRTWAQPFVWIGMNPITIYMIDNLVDMGAIARRFVGGDLKRLYLGEYGDLVAALVAMALTLGICRFLYKRKIFLRL
jgi:predicted acyltransferase